MLFLSIGPVITTQAAHPGALPYTGWPKAVWETGLRDRVVTRRTHGALRGSRKACGKES